MCFLLPIQSLYGCPLSSFGMIYFHFLFLNLIDDLKSKKASGLHVLCTKYDHCSRLQSYHLISYFLFYTIYQFPYLQFAICLVLIFC